MDGIAERVEATILRTLGVADAGASRRIDEIADSLEAVAILTALEEEFSIDLPDAEFFDAVTVADVIKAVEGKVGQL